MTASFSKSSPMPPTGWHSCSRYRGEHWSSVLGSLSKPTGMGRPDDQGRGRESRERPVLVLTGPRAVWVWGLGAGRSALTTHTHRPFPGGPAQQLPMHKGPPGRQACIRSERCPICWNPLSTCADPLSALGETSKRYCWSQY